MPGPFDSAIDALKRERERLVADLLRVTKLLDDLQVQADGLPRSASIEKVAPAERPEPDAPIVIYPDEFIDLPYADAARIVLSRAERPLTTRQIENALKLGGKPVGGKDPYRLLYRTLLKHGAFQSVNSKWDLRERKEMQNGDGDDE